MKQADFDEKLIERIAAGDGSAFREVYEVTSGAVYGYALSILKDPHRAEDVMHDAYLKLYANAGNYRPMGKPLAWVLVIVRNLCLSELRKEQPAEYSEAVAEPRPGRREDEQTEARVLIETALAHLSDEEAQIVTLHALTGWKMREIACLTGLPTSTVLSKYNRALKKMKQILS